MSKVIISQFDLDKEPISKNSWGHLHSVMLINEEEIKQFLDYVSSTEGYSSVKEYLRQNPLWKYSLDGGAKVALDTPL